MDDVMKDDSLLAKAQINQFIERRRSKNWSFAKTKHVGRVGDWCAGGDKWVYGKCVGSYYTVNGRYKNSHFIIEREDGSLVSALAYKGDMGRAKKFNTAIRQAKKEHKAGESLAGTAYHIMNG